MAEITVAMLLISEPTHKKRRIFARLMIRRCESEAARMNSSSRAFLQLRAKQLPTVRCIILREANIFALNSKGPRPHLTIIYAASIQKGSV